MYDYFIDLLILVKVIYGVATLAEWAHPTVRIDAIYHKVDKVFDGLICVLLLYLFKPWSPQHHRIDRRTCVLVAVYAVTNLLN